MSPLLLQGVWPLSVGLCSRDNNSNTYYNTYGLSLTQQHLLSYISILCHHNINAPTNICVYTYILTTYVSMLVGWCHVRTVKQCLLIRAQPEEGEYVGQYVHGCEQVNYHTHNTGRMHSIVGRVLHCVASVACAIPMATISSSHKLLDPMFMISWFFS